MTKPIRPFIPPRMLVTLLAMRRRCMSISHGDFWQAVRRTLWVGKLPSKFYVVVRSSLQQVNMVTPVNTRSNLSDDSCRLDGQRAQLP